MRIALVTTCRNRINHLSQTLPKNLADRDSFANVVYVVLDYGDQQGLGDYIQREHRADLDAGRLVYYRNADAAKFHMAHAKNQAHRCGIAEGATVLVNVDADNWIGPGFPAYVARRFNHAEEEREAIFLGTRANHRGPGDLVKVKTPPGCFGRIGVTVDAFRQAGGYDEIFAGWSPDDKDFAARVGNLGYGWRQIRPCYLAAIRHGGGLRFADYNAEAFDEVETLEGRAGFRICNEGRFGCGIVYRNFEARPIELKRQPTRIFGVGLHKTGTTSLAQAFRILGYDAAHWESPHWARYIWQEMAEQGRSRTLEMHYALTDLPIPLLFRQLDQSYPGSKFVLTTRDEDRWIASIRLHWQALRAEWDRDVFSNECHKLLYGTAEFDETVFRARYRKHNAEVRAYFRGRPDDLLELPMDDEPSMNPLCSFLNHPPMNRRMPHRHRSSEQPKYQAAQQGLKP